MFLFLCILQKRNNTVLIYKGLQMGAPLGNHNNPMLWDSPDALQAAIDAYFKACDGRVVDVYDRKAKRLVKMNKPVPYTVEGLAETCGFRSRQALMNYQRAPGYEAFHDIIYKAKLKIQRNKIERGLSGDANALITMFDLQNNHGYKNVRAHEVSGPDGGPVKYKHETDISDEELMEIVKNENADGNG